VEVLSSWQRQAGLRGAGGLARFTAHGHDEWLVHTDHVAAARAAYGVAHAWPIGRQPDTIVSGWSVGAGPVSSVSMVHGRKL